MSEHAPDGIEPIPLWRFWGLIRNEAGQRRLTSIVWSDIWEPHTRMDGLCRWRLLRNVLKEIATSGGLLFLICVILTPWALFLGWASAEIVRWFSNLLFPPDDAFVLYADNVIAALWFVIAGIVLMFGVYSLVSQTRTYVRLWRLPHPGGDGKPQAGCECGIYGLNTFESLRKEFVRSRLRKWEEPYLSRYAFGRILAWDNYVPGEHGFRFEHATIYDLFVTDERIARELREIYGVDVTVGLPEIPEESESVSPEA